MILTIPEIYLASCASFLFGALAVIGLAYAAAAWQRRTGRPKNK